MNDGSISNVRAVIEEYEGYLNLTANENSMSLTAKYQAPHIMDT